MTKRGSGNNAFDNDVLGTYYDMYEQCCWCNKSGADCMDHVISRKNKYTNSILNASPMHNHKCNINQHGIMHTPENTRMLIKKNAKRLHSSGYKLTELDINFIKEYNLYDIIIDIL